MTVLSVKIPISAAPADNDLLQFDIATGLWTPTKVIEGLTSVTASGTIQAEQLTSTRNITMQGDLLTLGSGSSGTDTVIRFLAGGPGGGISEISVTAGGSGMTYDGAFLAPQIQVSTNFISSGLAQFTGRIIKVGQYELPPVKGTIGHLLIQTDTGDPDQWGYKTPTPISGSWGFWTRDNGTGTITTATPLDDVELGGDLTLPGTTDTGNLIIRTDTTEDPVISLFGADGIQGLATNDSLTILGSGQASAFNIEFGFDQVYLRNTGSGRIIFISPLQLNDDIIFAFGSGQDVKFEYQTNQSGGGPDAFHLGIDADGTDTAPGSFLLIHKDSESFNFNHTNSIDPHFFIHSGQSSTTDWLSLYHNRTDGFIETGAGDLYLFPASKAVVGDKFKITAIGGYAVKLTNKSGFNSVAGDIVETSATTADAVDLAGTNSVDTVGVFLDSGVIDGDEAWIVQGGIADVHMDAGGCVLHDRIITSTTPGRGDVSNTPAIAVHFQEIGHALEVTGANGNARCLLHLL